jgi:hypothetical protein
MNINAPDLAAGTISMALETVHGYQVAHCFSLRELKKERRVWFWFSGHS